LGSYVVLSSFRPLSLYKVHYKCVNQIYKEETDVKRQNYLEVCSYYDLQQIFTCRWMTAFQFTFFCCGHYTFTFSIKHIKLVHSNTTAITTSMYLKTYTWLLHQYGTQLLAHMLCWRHTSPYARYFTDTLSSHKAAISRLKTVSSAAIPGWKTCIPAPQIINVTTTTDHL
jgi:hypothetical protein